MRFISKMATALTALSLAVGGTAYAQSTQPDPGHPRISQVETRIENQQNRIDRAESAGKLNAPQVSRDDARLAREQATLNRDIAANRGHITKPEQRALDQRLNRSGGIESHQIYHPKPHPIGPIIGRIPNHHPKPIGPRIRQLPGK